MFYYHKPYLIPFLNNVEGFWALRPDQNTTTTSPVTGLAKKVIEATKTATVATKSAVADKTASISIENRALLAVIENNKITNIENETKNVNEKIEYYNKYGFIKIRINRIKLNQFIDKILGDLSLENREKIKNRTNINSLMSMIYDKSNESIYLINKNNLDELIIPKVLISNEIESYLKITNLNNIPQGKIKEYKTKIINLLKKSDITTLILITDMLLKSFVSFFINFESQILKLNIPNLKFIEIAGDKLITLLSKNNCLMIKEDSFIEYDNDLCKIEEKQCPLCPEKQCPLCPEKQCPVCPEKQCPVCPEKQCPVCPEKQCPSNTNLYLLSFIFILIIVLLVFLLIRNK
jgi:hypothetical protein